MVEEADVESGGGWIGSFSVVGEFLRGLMERGGGFVVTTGAARGNAFVEHGRPVLPRAR